MKHAPMIPQSGVAWVNAHDESGAVIFTRSGDHLFYTCRGDAAQDAPDGCSARKVRVEIREIRSK